MPEESLCIQVRYDTAISPVGLKVIPTLRTCTIVDYILLYAVALFSRLGQSIAYYCVRRNMATFTSRFPHLRPGAKIINVFRAWIGAQLTICAQK